MYARDIRRFSEKPVTKPQFVEFEENFLTKEKEDEEKARIIQEYELIDLNKLGLPSSPKVPPRIYLNLTRQDPNLLDKPPILPFDPKDPVLDALQKREAIRLGIEIIRDVRIPPLETKFEVARVKLDVDGMNEISDQLSRLREKLMELFDVQAIINCWLYEKDFYS